MMAALGAGSLEMQPARNTVHVEEMRAWEKHHLVLRQVRVWSVGLRWGA